MVDRVEADDFEGRERPIVGVRDTLISIRSSVYQSTDYAVAELVDNSVDAGARRISIVLLGGVGKAGRHWAVKQLVVADDGSGMSPKELRNAPVLGISGVRRRSRSIGRYGYGLLAASLSQCRRFELFSWQEAGAVPNWVHVDLDEFAQLGSDQQPTVHWPDPKPFPRALQDAASRTQDLGADLSGVLEYQAGTVVLWDKIDRAFRSRVKTLGEHIERVLGRIYRYKIVEGVRLEILCQEKGGEFSRIEVLPNDPMYLMEGRTQTPEPFADRPMFTPFRKGGNDWSAKVIPVRLRDEAGDGGESSDVHILASIACEEALKWEDGKAPGDQPHGKHASRNLGVSVVRENRELTLISAITKVHAKAPGARFLGVEVRFGKELDEVFNVGNTKQHALDFEKALRDVVLKEDPSTARAEVGHEDPSLEDLYKVAGYVNYVVGQAFDAVSSLRKRGYKEAGRSPGTSGDPEGDGVAVERAPESTAEGIIQVKDRDRVREFSEAEKEERTRVESEIGPLLEKHGVAERGQGLEVAREVVRERYPAKFGYESLHTSAFFQGALLENGTVVIAVNKNHPLYDHLEHLRYSEDSEKERDRAHVAILLMLYGYYKYELGLRGELLDTAVRIRENWGVNVRDAVAEFNAYMEAHFDVPSPDEE